MARREIVVSDLTGKEIEEDRVARVTVSDHPVLGGRTVELDASAEEVESLESSRIQLVSVGIQLPGHSATRRVVMEVAAFDALLGDRDPADVLLAARTSDGRAPRQAARRGQSSGRRAERVEYTGRSRFGQLHRGRVTEEEAALVRSDLEQANRNRAAAGQPPIDPEGDADKKRYRF
jgi:hypothetical protein